MHSARKNGSIVYSFATPYDRNASILYINVVPKFGCPNSCRFCSKPDAVRGRQNIYEEKAGTNLYLNKAPKAEDILREVQFKAPEQSIAQFDATKEIAFVGLGEPLAQFELVCETIRNLRAAGYVGRIRIDTNGLAGLVRKSSAPLPLQPADCAHQLKAVGLSAIRISVNATNAEEYAALCRPSIKDAFEKVRLFVKGCISEGIDTSASFVVGFDDGHARTHSREEYLAFASTTFGLGADHVVLRNYMPPSIQQKAKPA